MKIWIALVLFVTALPSAFAGTQEKKEAFKLIHWNELKAWMDQSAKTPQDSHLAIFDANNADTRKNDGVIPGAVLLSSSKDFSADVLPKEKDSKVVFYCANTQCMASHHAAQRAVDAGFKNVYVMMDGIQGWKKAGQKTAQP